MKKNTQFERLILKELLMSDKDLKRINKIIKVGKLSSSFELYITGAIHNQYYNFKHCKTAWYARYKFLTSLTENQIKELVEFSKKDACQICGRYEILNLDFECKNCA